MLKLCTIILDNKKRAYKLLNLIIKKLLKFFILVCVRVICNVIIDKILLTTLSFTCWTDEASVLSKITTTRISLRRVRNHVIFLYPIGYNHSENCLVFSYLLSISLESSLL